VITRALPRDLHSCLTINALGYVIASQVVERAETRNTARAVMASFAEVLMLNVDRMFVDPMLADELPPGEPPLPH
jgi:hypothetical protein